MDANLIGARIFEEVKFAGGPPGDFDSSGRHTFIMALSCGLLPDHTFLDFGCGPLRLGFWFVRFLDPGKYYGLDPDKNFIEAGKKYALGDAVIAAKKPTFAVSRKCDMDRFGVKFDFVVARSVFTHMMPATVSQSLESFSKAASEGGIFLASYWLPTFKQDGPIGDDPKHQHDKRFLAVVKYSAEYLQELAKKYNLSARRVSPPTPSPNEQEWMLFSRSEERSQASSSAQSR